MKRLSWTSRMVGAATVAATGVAAHAQQYADVLGYYEPGLNAATVDVFGYDVKFTNPQAALGGPDAMVPVSGVIIGQTQTGIVSLGGWSDDPATGASDGRTPGLVVGFSTPVTSRTGYDFLIKGNNSFGNHEPAIVEVARETSGGGATATGWEDETFYLLKPSNFDQISDPRTHANAISYAYDNDLGFFVYGPGPFANGGTLLGYADTAVNGPDYFELDWAIDASNDPVVLSDIAYVRIRTVTDSAIDYSVYGGTTLDYFSAEIDYVQAVPEPAGLMMLAGLMTLVAARRRVVR